MSLGSWSATASTTPLGMTVRSAFPSSMTGRGEEQQQKVPTSACVCVSTHLAGRVLEGLLPWLLKWPGFKSLSLSKACVICAPKLEMLQIPLSAPIEVSQVSESMKCLLEILVLSKLTSAHIFKGRRPKPSLEAGLKLG